MRRSSSPAWARMYESANWDNGSIFGKSFPDNFSGDSWLGRMLPPRPACLCNARSSFDRAGAIGEESIPGNDFCADAAVDCGRSFSALPAVFSAVFPTRLSWVPAARAHAGGADASWVSFCSTFGTRSSCIGFSIDCEDKPSSPWSSPLESGWVGEEASVCAMARSRRSRTRQEWRKRTSRFVGCTFTSTSLAGTSRWRTVTGCLPCINRVRYPLRIAWWNGVDATGLPFTRMWISSPLPLDISGVLM